MITRLTKLILLASVAIFHTLVVFNNLTDFDSNYQFVRHVLMMDSTFPGNQGMWRALNSPVLHLASYWSIIAWEFGTTVLCWWGAWRLLSQMKSPAAQFNAAKGIPILALLFGMLLWFGAFLTVGGEWFLMWQSAKWNGQQAAFRMFTTIGVVLLVMLQPERNDQP